MSHLNNTCNTASYVHSYDVNVQGSKSQCLSSWGDTLVDKVPGVLSSKPQHLHKSGGAA